MHNRRELALLRGDRKPARERDSRSRQVEEARCVGGSSASRQQRPSPAATGLGLEAQPRGTRPVALGGRRRRLHPLLAARSDQQEQRQDAEDRLAPGRLRPRDQAGVSRAARLGQLPLHADHGQRRALRAQRASASSAPSGRARARSAGSRRRSRRPSKRSRGPARAASTTGRAAATSGCSWCAASTSTPSTPRTARTSRTSATRAASTCTGTIRWPACSAGPPARWSSTT